MSEDNIKHEPKAVDGCKRCCDKGEEEGTGVDVGGEYGFNDCIF